MKSILLIMKSILRIVGLETGYAERIRKCQEKVHVYKSILGQNKPFISDGFEVQTIHSQPVWLQAVMRISAGLKGFSGKKLRNARERKHISVLSEPQPKVHVYELLCLEGTTERSDGNRGRSPRIVNARTMCLEGTTP